MVSTVEARELTRWTQPPDAENRMSGGVGGLTGAIPLVRPDVCPTWACTSYLKGGNRKQ